VDYQLMRKYLSILKTKFRHSVIFVQKYLSPKIKTFKHKIIIFYQKPRLLTIRQFSLDLRYLIPLILFFFILFFTLRVVFPKKSGFQKAPLLSGWTYQADLALPHSVVSAKTTQTNSIINFKYQNASLEFNLPLEHSTVDLTNSNQIVFTTKEKNIGAEYQLLDNGLKENIILQKIPPTNQFASILKTTNADIYLNSDNLPVFLDPVTGEYLFHVQKPYAFDAAGNVTYAVSYKLYQDNKPLTPKPTVGKNELLRGLIKLTQGSIYQLIVKIDSNWLFDPARVYPITIDPTVVHDTSSKFSSGQFNRMVDIGTSFITSAVGGTITYVNGYTIHTFLGGGTFTPGVAGNVEVLVVAGGGGGANTGSGGGAGGYVYYPTFSVAAQGYSITVGTGGPGGSTTSDPGDKGNNSVFSSITAEGGGAGQSHGGCAGGNGGSGGGGPISTTCTATGGTGSQGFIGGAGYLETGWVGNNGGGGGAGGPGSPGGNTSGTGNGGPGYSSSISGSIVCYAGGGGGGEVNGSYVGTAVCGGGNGNLNTTGSNGSTNTGGGGGGGSYTGSYYNGGDGGSGIVVIRYPTALSLTSYYQPLPADINTVGLWHLNEASGNAIDSSGNGITLTNHGSTVVSGLSGNARNLDGTNDYLAATDNTKADFSTGDFTIEAWVNTGPAPGNDDSSQCDWPMVISKEGGSPRRGFNLITNQPGYTGTYEPYPYIEIFDGSGSADTSNYGTDINDGQWHHLTGVKTSTALSFYIDGILQNTKIHSLGSIGNTAVPLTFGQQGSGGSSCMYKGLLDEVRISNVARSAEEIRLDASRRPYSVYTSPVIDLGTSTPISWNSLSWTEAGVNTGNGETLFDTTSLVAQWNFNNLSGTTATNDAGSCSTSCNGRLYNFGNLGSQDTLPGDGWTANNKRWGAGALMFDGVNEYISVSDNNALSFGNGTVDSPFSISTWVKPDSLNTGSDGNWIINKRDDATNMEYELEFWDQQLWFELSDSGTGTTGWMGIGTVSTFQPGQWYYIAATYDGSSSLSGMKIYVNGVLQSQSADSYKEATYTAMSNGNQPVIIGRAGWTSNYEFNGIIDSTAIFSRVLSASEILSNYQAGNIEFQTRVGSSTDANDGTWEAWKPVTSETTVDSYDGPYQYNTTDSGLIGYWPMDEVGGTAVADVKGSYNGIATGAGIGGGKFGKGRTFNGTNQYVSVGSSLPGIKSVEYWVYPTTLAGGHVRFQTSIGVTVSSTGRISAPGFTSPTYYVNGQVGTTIIANTWNHVVVTTGTGFTGNLNTFGRYNTNYLNGRMDEVRIYNTALSAATVQQHFIEGSTNSNFLLPSTDTVIKMEGSASEKVQIGTPQADANTVGLWHLEETGSAVGTTFYDSSGFDNHGIATTVPTVADGVSGKARYFSGSSYIQVPHNSSLNITDDFTLMAWVKRTGGSNGYIIAKEGSGGSGGYELVTGSAGEIYCRTDNGSSYTDSYTDYGGYVSITSGWVHIAAVRTGSSCQVYVNGQDLTNTFGVHTTLVGNTLPVRIGTDNNRATPWVGYIDEVVISNTAHTPEEIAESYRAGRDHYLNKTISSTDLSGKTSLPFYVASDRQGTFLNTTIGESGYVNYQPDANTVGLWHLDDPQSFSAVGGTITYSGGYTIHTFTSNGTFTSTAAGNVQVLVIGGGGGGGNNAGGGGGAGGYVEDTSYAVTPGNISVTVGDGGAGSSVACGGRFSGANGDDSVFGSITAYGGGGGHAGGDCRGNGYDGGSGGGAAAYNGTSYTGGDGSQGYKGGDAESTGLNCSAGGGGGAGGAGEDIYVTGGVNCSAGGGALGGDGGDGVASSITGSSVTRASGGGGYPNGSAPSGGGGASEEVGTPNTGGGGGAYEDGGSGIVIIRYPINTLVNDSSGNGNTGTAYGTTLTRGKIGQARRFNGTSDYIDLGTNAGLKPQNITVEAWINTGYLGVDPWEAIVERQKNAWVSYRLGWNGLLSFEIGSTEGSPYGAEAQATQNFDDGNWHHVVGTYNHSQIKLYVDGVLQASTPFTQDILYSGVSPARIGQHNNEADSFFPGLIDEVRISNVARTADEIRQAYEVGTRSHNITIDFKAKLAAANLVVGSTDYSFTISSMVYGAGTSGANLYLGDKIIIKEKIGSTEYIAQGTVNAVNASSGAVTVASWDGGSTFPSGGFTINATVFKWQREYFDLGGSLSTQRDAITNLTMRITDGFQGANVWLDDLRSNSGNLTLSAGSTITSTTGYRYFQYRTVLTSSDPFVSPSFSSVTLNYNANTPPATPTLIAPGVGVTNVSQTPSFKTVTTDPESDNLQYEVKICTDSGMSASCNTFTAANVGWSGANVGTSSFSSGTTATYVLQAGNSLAVNTTYYWKTRAIDPAGSNTWSGTQGSANSFTTNQTPNTPTLISPGIGVTNVSQTPSFKTVTTDPDADNLQYEVKICTDSGMSASCNTFTAANVGWSGANVGTSSFSSGTTATYVLQAGNSLATNTTYYWKTRAIDPAGSNTWSGTQGSANSFTTNQAPNTPSLIAPADTAIGVSQTPSFVTVTTDPNSDNLQYEVKICNNSGMSASCNTFTAANVGWSGANVGTSSFSSGTTATYVLQAGNSLATNTTYYWKTRAIDPAGSNVWSATQANAFSFTIGGPPPPPTAASNCRIQESNNDTSLNIIWTDNATDEDRYEIQRSVDSAAWSIIQTDMAANTASYQDSTITQGHTYQYRVSPYYTAGSASLNWCSTVQLSIQSGNFKLEGVKLDGLNLN
jgi:hypothetical protein